MENVNKKIEIKKTEISCLLLNTRRSFVTNATHIHRLACRTALTPYYGPKQPSLLEADGA